MGCDRCDYGSGWSEDEAAAVGSAVRGQAIAGRRSEAIARSG